MTLAELPAHSLLGAGEANGAEAVDEQLPTMAVSAAEARSWTAPTVPPQPLPFWKYWSKSAYF